MADSHHHDAPGKPHGHDSHYQAYMQVFIILCVCTAASFVVNFFLHDRSALASAIIIMIVAIAKAYLVVRIFMHLKQDWGTVYPIMIPVAILCVMTIIILSIDTVMVWHPE
jgi:caa(3)-type oxidase subunit IV